MRPVCGGCRGPLVLVQFYPGVDGQVFWCEKCDGSPTPPPAVQRLTTGHEAIDEEPGPRSLLFVADRVAQALCFLALLTVAVWILGGAL